MLKVVKALALVLTVVAFMPVAAHLLDLHRTNWTLRHTYSVTREFYGGWVPFRFALFGALAANLWLAVALLRRRRHVPARLALAAGLLAASGLVVLLAWAYPADLATENWTRVPDGWDALRRRWEYSHAVSAGLLPIALFSVSLSVALDDKGGDRS